MSIDLVELGRALQERRQAVGIPRAEVARRTGVSSNYIWAIERARKRKGGNPSQPSKEILERWAKALGWDEVYTRQILALAGHGDPKTPVEAQPRLPFDGVGAFHFPQPRALERERLRRAFDEVLELIDASADERDETIKLVESFLEWMRFHLKQDR
jgi:transcriptional regulator with XRE-family HTH domain